MWHGGRTLRSPDLRSFFCYFKSWLWCPNYTYNTIISFQLVFRTSDWGSPNATNYFGPIASEYPNETTCAFRAFRADAGQPDEYMVSLHVRFYNSFYYYFPKHASSFNKIMKSFFFLKNISGWQNLASRLCCQAGVHCYFWGERLHI